jgi:hypothetical protein
MKTRPLSQLRRSLAFARHLRPQQVVRRIQLDVLRRWRVLRPPRAALPDARSALRQDLPNPLLPARGGLERTPHERWRFTFLNRSRDFGWPIDWDLRDAGAHDQLWKMHLHYMEYLEAASGDDFCALVDDWIRRNRPYRPH